MKNNFCLPNISFGLLKPEDLAIGKNLSRFVTVFYPNFLITNFLKIVQSFTLSIITGYKTLDKILN